jgi:hypothetical protein
VSCSLRPYHWPTRLARPRYTMSNALMDSSPQPIPQRSSLKRSASTASLPTPPRSVIKRTTRRRAGSRASDYVTTSDEEEEDCQVYTGGKMKAALLFDDAGENTNPHGLPGCDSENPFWAPPQKSLASLNCDAMEIVRRSPSPCRASSTNIPPLSPPPSRRHTRHNIAPPTPRHSPNENDDCSLNGPVRDSPNNPFLVSAPSASSFNPTPPQDFSEKPTITYVL